METKHANIAILLLAAGSSTRMGSPKQLLKWGSTTLLNHSINQAINSNAHQIFVVLGANYKVIKKSIIYRDVTILRFKNWRIGMGSSIAFGVQKIKPLGFDGALIMLADQPQINTVFINKLIHEFRKEAKPIIATKYTQEVGVPAIFDASFFNQLVQLKGEKGGKSLLEKNLKNLSVVLPNLIYKDIDTQEDYEKQSAAYLTQSK